MMSELSFLIDLLLKHKLPLATKELIATRIKEVEQANSFQPMPSYKMAAPTPTPVPTALVQAASTQAILDRNPDLASAIRIAHNIPAAPPPEPVAVVAQTPATVAALNTRQQMIADSMSGKVDKETGRPKKYHQ